MDICKNDGEVLIIGDFNCHFGPEHGSRFWGKATQHAKSVINMIDRHGLCIIDGDKTMCEGPNYTFNVDGVGCSYIDHCIVSQTLLTHILHCQILPDNLLNTSDHLAMTVQLKVESIPARQKVSHNSKIAWKKISPDEIKHLYTEPLQLELEALGNDKECKNGNDTDDMLRNTVQIIHKHSARLKKSKYSKGLKPYWNETLKTQFKAKNDLWKKWQEDGSPKSGITYNEYRQAKRVFRQELRNAKLAYEKS